MDIGLKCDFSPGTRNAVFSRKYNILIAIGAGGSSSSGAPLYLTHLSKDSYGIVSVDGDAIEAWTLSVPAEETHLSDWAWHFRQNYCLDEELDDLREDTGLSRAEYLQSLVFPSDGGFGPGVRAGDFAELLVSDYLEFILGYKVPRLKYADKTNPNESMKGVDVVGFLCKDPTDPRTEDELLAFEVKARLSDNAYAGRLQDAINDSGSDFSRLAYTLNKAKRLLRARNDTAGARIVARFQNKADRPFKLRFGAGAVLSDSIYDTDLIATTTTAAHPHREDLQILVVHGEELMALVHALYRRSANEA